MPDMLVFVTGGERFALPVPEVDALARRADRPLYPLPVPDERAAGLIGAEGEPVPVLRFPCLPRAASADGVYILARAGDARFALEADELDGIGAGDGARVLRADSLLRSVCGG